MHPTELVSSLEALAARLGVPVRYETMEHGRSRGGLCRLRGQAMIIVDEKLGPSDRVAVLAQALGSFELDDIYLPPLVRATIRAHGKARALEPRPLARARPDRNKE